MRSARFDPPELRDYIAARGGVLRVSIQATMHG